MHAVRRAVGNVLMAAGATLALVGVIGWVTDGGGDTVAATTQPTTSTQVTSTTDAPTTTGPPTTTTQPSTTSTTEATTTTSQPTTTTVAAGEAIAGFVGAFAAWIADGDVDALMAALHPAVIEASGEDLCRAFVEREILALVDYRLAGEVTGPRSATFGSGSIDMYEAPISFTFQGAAFDDTAQFAFVDGDVRWFATCR